jgi:hypothetical protein
MSLSNSQFFSFSSFLLFALFLLLSPLPLLPLSLLELVVPSDSSELLLLLLLVLLSLLCPLLLLLLDSLLCLFFFFLLSPFFVSPFFLSSFLPFSCFFVVSSLFLFLCCPSVFFSFLLPAILHVCINFHNTFYVHHLIFLYFMFRSLSLFTFLRAVHFHRGAVSVHNLSRLLPPSAGSSFGCLPVCAQNYSS